MRTAEKTRKTKETDIEVKLDLDGSGKVHIDTGIGFFNHMLTAFAVHSGIDLSITCRGDLEVDGHHSVEDVGIVLGKAVGEALGDKAGIERYGNFYVPMDEALAFCAMDISGRPYLLFNADFHDERIGEFDTCLCEEFFCAFAFNAGITLHIRESYGKNDHHICEAIFKAVAHALKAAIKVNSDGSTLSTKGVLE
ncbi:MAG: imidazoleglycerol-phosphate dehydratase HisB [Ruminococcus sp.]|nr:imidazoleglycerol-phosphate dehydratase HisB [Ruminococcus sp.]